MLNGVLQNLQSNEKNQIKPLLYQSVEEDISKHLLLDLGIARNFGIYCKNTKSTKMFKSFKSSGNC